MLNQRVITVLIAGPVFLLLLWLNGWWLAGLMIVLTLIGWYEYWRLMQAKGGGRAWLWPVGFLYIDLTISAGIADAVFCYKNRKSFLYCLYHFAPQFFPVRSCIKMQRIHNIVIFCNGIRSSLIHKLGPVGSSHNNHCIRIIGPDYRDHFQCIAFYIRPGGLSIWFIADLIQDVAGIRISR